MSKKADLMTSREIFEKMKELLMDALAVDEEEIVLNANLLKDLGADSVDYLDIAFRTMKAFSVRIDRGDYPVGLLSAVCDKCDKMETDGDRVSKSFVRMVQRDFQSRLPFSFVLPNDAEDVTDFLTIELLCCDVAHRLGVEWSSEGLPE